MVWIVQRSDDAPDHPGQWVFPGGMLDEGETHLDAGIREIGQEVGLSEDELDILGFFAQNSFDPSYVTYVAVRTGDGPLNIDGYEIISSKQIPLRKLIALDDKKLISALRIVEPYKPLEIEDIKTGGSIALLLWALRNCVKGKRFDPNLLARFRMA